MKISVQMYSFRSTIQSDLEGHLKALKNMGYEFLEFAGFYDLHPVVLKKLLTDIGLKGSSSHTSLKDLENRYDELIETFRILNINHIVIPYTEMKDQASYQAMMPRIKQITKELNKDGFTVHYHNHANEFQSFDGMYIIEHLMKDVEGIYLEFDIYWAKVAGVDIDQFIKTHHKKIKLLHAKDYQLDIDGTPYFESVGKGILDFKQTIKALKNLDYIVVENDKPRNDAFINVEDSINYINQLLKEI
jgi:sugar phosphate isomerase/epimerase